MQSTQAMFVVWPHDTFCGPGFSVARKLATLHLFAHLIRILMPYTPIVATLGYVLSPDKSKVLLIHRNARTDDQHLGKYNGLGGKMEPEEDVVACMRREIREEAAIECESLCLRGTISWPGFGKHGEDWLGFVFLVESFSGTPLQRNAEGELEWIAVAHIMELPLWDGDRHFLPLVFDTDTRAFHGVMPYRDGKAVSWNYSRI
jgi:8-oxo-dGTP diphosphatase